MLQTEEAKSIPIAKMVGAIIIGIVILWIAGTLLFGSWYTVDQNQVGAVTRFGQLVSKQPEAPGFHWKAPFIDDVHKIRVSMDRIDFGAVNFKTADNQFGSVDVSVTYHTGDPFKVLFKVGEMGPGGVIDKVSPVVRNRALQIFGTVNALQITDQLASLQKEILEAIKGLALENFGEDIVDVQLTDLKYSQAFEASVEQMVTTRNQQIQAENILKVKRTEAEQAVAVAKGRADSLAADADGARRAAIAQAEGDAQKVRLTADAAAYDITKRAEAEANAKKIIGAAEAEVIATKVKSAGTASDYSAILRAEAAKNWNGSVPRIELSGDKGGAQPVMILPAEK